MICQNLERAAQLISSFKRVSVDQASEQCRRFDLITYLDEIQHSLKPKLKQANPSITIQGPKQLILNSYPGSYYQIFTNLILNSLLHGFDNQPGGEITIEIKRHDERLQIDYRDNGAGVPVDWQTKLFEPFMTTKRNRGCSGLGMHIAYNLVSQLLQGHISCIPDSNGAHFHIDLPMTPTQTTVSGAT
ncbi:HAMP domain-containing sensor histidine kinase [Amphritea sp. 1_MG-2023]|uniref:sensor histidine kinase n=1 Tax=Amphritea sp. 1_MG-2023 TaxID=3062670 RepID=UPI0026E2CEAF|nr:HAMP domain-containing sensor histidine kinase [Amphritea sp. 1_MG-2023]MDO6565175.1 HAMP domain-containing sensor histidine kinase [Amphritea sp. 1_MG-2023]